MQTDLDDSTENERSESLGQKKPTISRMIDETRAITGSPAARKWVSNTLLAAIKKIPVAGDIVDIGQVIVNGLIEMEHEERRHRLEEFALGLRELKIGEEHIPQEDFLAVIRKLLQDDETAKARYYSQLLIGLGRNQLDQGTRLHYLRMISDLTFFQIEYAKEFVIRRTIPLIGYQTEQHAVQELTARDDAMSRRALSTLVSWGLVKEFPAPQKWTSEKNTAYDLTPEMATLTSILFVATPLNAEMLGLQQKTFSDIIIEQNVSSAGRLYEDYLPAQLRAQHGLSVELVEQGREYRLNRYSTLVIQNRTLTDGSLSTANQNVQVIITQYLRIQETPKVLDKTFTISSNVFMAIHNKQKNFAPLRQELDKVISGVLQMLQEIKSAENK